MIHYPRISIIALETLAIYIRGSDEIKGINIRNEHEIKLTAFADDMTTFLKDDQSAGKLLHVLNDFGRCSGLKLNESKLEACYLGTSSPADFHLNVDIKSCIEILGIFFSYNKKDAAKLNFESILNSLKKKLNLWKWRNLTVLGRVQIVKTFAINYHVCIMRVKRVCDRSTLFLLYFALYWTNQPFLNGRHYRRIYKLAYKMRLNAEYSAS